MIIPPYIQAGDRIRVVSPAGKIDQQRLLPALELLEQQGFELIHSSHSLNSHFQFSGTDQQRLADLQEALDDPACKAILCSRGGYGAIRLLDKLDLGNLKKHPKWLVGFSDITNLHNLLQKEGIASIHGAMPGFYLKDDQPTESFESLLSVLTGRKQSTTIEPHKMNRRGSCSAPLVGGNLSILYSLQGTPFELDTRNKILFIEDLSEYLYHLDRIMQSMRLSGKFDQLAGLLVGQFTDMKDNDHPFGQSVEEIILQAVQDFSFPVCFNYPAGHVERNLPLILGATYQLEVGEQVNLSFNDL